VDGACFGAAARPPAGVHCDVALQFTPAPTTDAATVPFPLSDDGKYYNVNVLRRGPAFPAPTATAVFISPAVQHITPPSSSFDGDDSALNFVSGSPPAGNPTAAEILTIDLGRVVSLGAARQLYVGTSTSPTSFKLRLTEIAGQWTTVVPTQLVDQSVMC
jgi:hypothetical protein